MESEKNTLKITKKIESKKMRLKYFIDDAKSQEI